MVDLKKLQKDIYQNKVDKGFNVTDVNKEFCLTYGEVAEAYEAWRKKKEIHCITKCISFLLLNFLILSHFHILDSFLIIE